MAQLIHGTTINGHIAIHAGNMSDHSIATTTYVGQQITNLINGAPGALDTLNELAAALGNNASFATSVTNGLAGKLSLSGGTMTGQIYIPSAGTGVYEGAIQIREQGYVGSNQSDWNYAPAITFHWGNRHVQRFGVRADGLFAVDNEPLALRSWVTSQSYLTSLPSHNHDDRYYTEAESDSRFAAVSHTHDLLRYSLRAPANVDSMTSSNFRTQMFGSSTSGWNLSTGRWNSVPTGLNGMNMYGTIFAWSGSDTHGFIAADYSTANIQVGGGSGDSITWKATLIHSSNIGSQSVNYASSAGSVAWGNITGTPSTFTPTSHNHDDRYYTETESDGRYLYYRGMNQETDFQRFVDTPGIIRFDQANATGGFANAPGGYAYGGVLSMRGVNFGFQLWGSHTGDFYYKTQWQNDQYSGWREVITSLNIGSQSVSYASQVGINYNNNSNSTYQLLWGSGNSVYGTGGVYLNPSTDYVYASSFVASDWLRTTGNTGWYSETYGGGWYMTDSSYLRPYNGKSISMGNASVDYVNQLHFNDNVRFYQDGNNQYLNFKWGNSGAGGIIFMDGDGSRQGYLYASGTGSIGILDSGGSWKVRVDTSDVEMYGTQYLTDVYANIIYDRNNSAYYVNPASTSRINSTIIYGGTSGTSPRLTFMTTDDNDTNKYIGMVSYWTQIGCHVNEGLRLVNSNGTEQFYVRGGTSGNEAWFRGNLIGATSVSSPIFYDSDNGAYYGNFSGSSRLYLLGLGGATPDVALSVSGTAHVDGTLYLGGTAGTVNSWGTRTTGASGYWINSSRDVTFNNGGYGDAWTFHINSAGAVKINRHIDANTGWGSASGNTLFVGWYGGKVILGNNSDSGHDYASAITAQSIVSTNRHYFYKGASLNNSVQGADVFTVDGVNGRLFTVTDDLSDSLFSVNTIAGLPVIEAFADNTVKIGPYSAPVTFSASGISTTSHGTSANWLTAYNKRPTGVSFSGSSTKTLTLTLGDGSTLTAAFNDIDTDTDTNTDAQTLTLNGSTLSISGGNSITLPASGISQGTADSLYVNVTGDTMSGRLTLKSISGVEQTVPNDYGAYLHLGAWGVGRTDATAVLVNSAYRADYATDLFDMNISRFTNNSGYITSSGRAYPRRSDGGDLNFYWSGQSGQPTWLWGGTDGTNMYVYNPSNFSVNYAASAGAVAWTNVTSRPTALSSFTNDLGNYGGFLTSLPSHNHDGVYVPINPDGDGPSWSYADNNPTINGKYVGGGQRFGADGSVDSGFLQSKHLNAYDGHVNSSDGYYVGVIEYGSIPGAYDTTQVIDSSGRWTGVAIADAKIASSSNWNTAYGWGNHAGLYASSGHTHTFASLTSKPTTISGYGITDAITTSNIGSQSVNYAASAGSVAWTNVSGRPTALSQFTNDLGLGGAAVTIQDSAPAGTAGKLWWESDTGKLKVYYGSAWVDASPIPDMSLYYSKAGGSINGDVTVRQTLTVVGNTLIQGVLTETSDISLKENILPLENSLDKVMKLNGVSFNKKATPNMQEIGFIAQEVEAIIPDLVTETGEGIKTVSYSRVTAVLVETIKEQQAQINALTDMVNSLTKKLDNL